MLGAPSLTTAVPLPQSRVRGKSCWKAKAGCQRDPFLRIPVFVLLVVVLVSICHGSTAATTAVEFFGDVVASEASLDSSAAAAACAYFMMGMSPVLTHNGGLVITAAASEDANITTAAPHHPCGRHSAMIHPIFSTISTPYDISSQWRALFISAAHISWCFLFLFIPLLVDFFSASLSSSSATTLHLRSGGLGSYQDIAMFQIFYRNLTGKTVALEIDSTTTTVRELKALIEAKEDIPPDEQRLLLGGKQLEDGCRLEECGIQKEATLDLALRLRGGMRQANSANAEDSEGRKDKITITLIQNQEEKRLSVSPSHPIGPQLAEQLAGDADGATRAQLLDEL